MNSERGFLLPKWSEPTKGTLKSSTNSLTGGGEAGTVWDRPQSRDQTREAIQTSMGTSSRNEWPSRLCCACCFYGLGKMRHSSASLVRRLRRHSRSQS
jgi:hypothetical protein